MRAPLLGLANAIYYFTSYGARGGERISCSSRSFNIDTYHSQASGDEESHAFNVD